MDTIYLKERVRVCSLQGVCVCMGMELTLQSGHGITAGSASRAFIVQIKTPQQLRTDFHQVP